MTTARTHSPLAALRAGLGTVGSAVRRSPDDLTDQVAFITGGSRGLGLAMARAFAHAGCRVAICARDAEELSRAASDLRAEGIELFTACCDVAEHAEIEQGLADTSRHFGRVDILVNNAGIIQAGPLATMTVADFEEAMGVMF